MWMQCPLCLVTDSGPSLAAAEAEAGPSGPAEGGEDSSEEEDDDFAPTKPKAQKRARKA